MKLNWPTLKVRLPKKGSNTHYLVRNESRSVTPQTQEDGV
jgi:hypothetical protein